MRQQHQVRMHSMSFSVLCASFASSPICHPAVLIFRATSASDTAARTAADCVIAAFISLMIAGISTLRGR